MMLRRTRTVALLVGAIALTGAVGGAQTLAGRRAEAAAIARADEDFCRATIDRDLDRFLSFVSDHATFGGGGDEPLRGRDAVARAWAPFFQADGPTLTWKPTRAEVLVGGDVGYTVGSWERRTKGKDGRLVVGRGQYFTVWKKQADGRWQVIFDGGSEEPAAK